MIVHHINGDPRNNAIDNLELREAPVWLTVTHEDGYRTFDVGPFDSEEDARLMLEGSPDRHVATASIQRDGVELDWWAPGKGWEGET